MFAGEFVAGVFVAGAGVFAAGAGEFTAGAGALVPDVGALAAGRLVSTEAEGVTGALNESDGRRIT